MSDPVPPPPLETVMRVPGKQPAYAKCRVGACLLAGIRTVSMSPRDMVVSVKYKGSECNFYFGNGGENEARAFFDAIMDGLQ